MNFDRKSSGGLVNYLRPHCLFLLIVLFSDMPVAVASSLGAEPQDAAPEQQNRNIRIRFHVTALSGSAIPEAEASLFWWHKTESGFEKSEIQQKADHDGFVEFAVANAARVMISVTAKGYRPYWRWIRVNTSKSVQQIKMEAR
jgi:hypothetical protein